MQRTTYPLSITLLLLFSACPKIDNDVGGIEKDASGTAQTGGSMTPPVGGTGGTGSGGASVGSVDSGQTNGKLGTPCSVRTEYTPAQAVYNREAPECSSQLCLKPAVKSDVPAPDTGALCTAQCLQDSDCDGLLRDPSNPDDKSCMTGYTCGVAFVKGDLCCQKLCICMDFTGGPMKTPTACENGGNEMCNGSPPPIQVVEYVLPTTSGGPHDITVGPDGNLWFTEELGNKIGRITTSGVFAEFPIPTPSSNPGSITAGPDGNLWFIEQTVKKIGRITTKGTITEFPLPETSRIYLNDITVGPDGNLWFTEEIQGNKIGRITTTGTITEFVLPATLSSPTEIVAGPDGNLWFLGSLDRIGRITTSGTITEFLLPGEYNYPSCIAVGPDGNLWFGTVSSEVIRKITPGGVVTEVLQMPSMYLGSVMESITFGPDGSVWFTGDFGNQVTRITPENIVMQYTLQTSESFPKGIVVGPDGNIWFTERGANKIGRIIP